ncbi:acyl-CoA/acyl-ACP dehydrogenase [Metallosphaera tengchongensis]|uniref:Acyl-CoA/acyl-ACP dehydrogenase n=2 Tax=Metallosphaera tengchongensis TaxID=1532350 RepID=A0A6N0P040_9CREN|nr:acyl-CoA/acyl-ACP dehydrogenase [Metallosphaera tengchongensis]
MEKYNVGYWNEMDSKEEFPQEFFKEFVGSGFGSILIPKEFGGAGLGTKEASLILREINRLGGNSYFVHGQYYNLALLNKCASQELKERIFPEMVRDNLLVLSLALTEPEAGSESTRITTFAEERGDRYVINGRKVFISRVDRTDFLVLVARTKPYNEERKTEGISMFLVDMRQLKGQVEMRRIRTMSNTDAYELYINNLEVTRKDLLGKENDGFKCLLRCLNAERIMIAAEMVGNTEYFLERAVDYSRERRVFGRPIGQNQGVQFPLAQAYMELMTSSTTLKQALDLYETSSDERSIGTFANIAKFKATEAAWYAGNVAMDVYGGLGYARDLGIERKVRETRLFLVAPISKNLILADIAHNVLKLPRSF